MCHWVSPWLGPVCSMEGDQLVLDFNYSDQVLIKNLSKSNNVFCASADY